jgi:tRNA-specific 2-thiouridylase
MGLPVADKPDSEEICFIPDNDYRRFLRERLAAEPGEIVDQDGEVVAHHDGIVNFTVGQRRGIGAYGDRRYVIALEPASNRVVIGSGSELLCGGLIAGATSWISGAPPADGDSVLVKFRYKAALAPATVHSCREGIELRFEQPQRAVAPGQAAVCYDGEVVLGGGTILRTFPAT